MNIWLKSLLAGSIVALLIFFLSDKLQIEKSPKKYTIQYTINVEPDTNSTIPFSFSKVMTVLQKRLDMASYIHEINAIDDTTIKVSLFEMTDTLSPVPILTSTGRVQFREVYTMNELSEMLKEAARLIKAMDPPLVPARPVTYHKDTVSKAVSDLLDSMEMFENAREQEKESELLIDFTMPYNNGSASIVYPAEIGEVKIKDTATVRKLFQTNSILSLSPADIQLCYGEVQQNMVLGKKDPVVNLYFLNTKGSPDKAILENDDIDDARQDFDESGRAMIAMQFNRNGIRKWADMTRQNIGRSIAIVIDRNVISAPTVIDAIEDGSSTINGSFSVQDCEILSIGLRSSKLPANLTITASNIKSASPSKPTSRKLLVTFITFIVFSGLAFFIFKALKTS